MKSLIEEATSVEKAIEKAWTRAGKPHTFSVKIFEEPEKNFFGFLTKKSAKVGIFFDEKHVQQIADEKGEKTQSVNTTVNRRPTQQRNDEQRSSYRPNNNRNQPRRDRNHDGRPQQEQSEKQHADRRSHSNHRHQERPVRTQERDEQRQTQTSTPHHVQQQEAPQVRVSTTTHSTEQRESRAPRNHDGDREQRADRTDSRNRRPRSRRPAGPRSEQHERQTQQHSDQHAPVAPSTQTVQTTAPVFEFTPPSAAPGVKKNLRASSRRYIARREESTDKPATQDTPNNNSSDNQ